MVRTLPFHGNNAGSNPTKDNFNKTLIELNFRYRHSQNICFFEEKPKFFPITIKLKIVL